VPAASEIYVTYGSGSLDPYRCVDMLSYLTTRIFCVSAVDRNQRGWMKQDAIVPAPRTRMDGTLRLKMFSLLLQTARRLIAH
jgi:hypothetical protein